MHEIASAGVQAFLNMQHIKGFEVPIPELKDQLQFSSLTSYIRKTLDKHIITGETPLFEVLSQKAFAGEL